MTKQALSPAFLPAFLDGIPDLTPPRPAYVRLTPASEAAGAAKRALRAKTGAH